MKCGENKTFVRTFPLRVRLCCSEDPLTPNGRRICRLTQQHVQLSRVVLHVPHVVEEQFTVVHVAIREGQGFAVQASVIPAITVSNFLRQCSR